MDDVDVAAGARRLAAAVGRVEDRVKGGEGEGEGEGGMMWRAALQQLHLVRGRWEGWVLGGD